VSHREITAAELETVFSLAATIPDLTTIPADLAELASLRLRVQRVESAFIDLKRTQFDLRDAVRRLASAKGVPA
jgi:hypothetical protein